VLLTLPEEVKVEIVQDTVTIAVGEMTVKLEAAAGGRLTATAGGTSITMKKDSDLSISSSAKIKIEGSEVEIAGQSKVKITGAMVEIN
jgi:hypothetical protein